MKLLGNLSMDNKSISAKYLILGLILLVCLVFSPKVYAEEAFYTNDNGVSLTEEEYEFIKMFYWDGYPALMTLEDYQEFHDTKVMESEVEVKEIFYGNDLIPYGTEFTTSYKSLKISKGCSSNCLISVTLQWLTNPAVRSYDVIGAYIEGTTFANTPSTVVSSSTSANSIHDIRKESNGIGVSFELPSGSNVTINQSYRVNTGGHVYASYQHAKKTSTLAKSKDYEFSYFGYGGVFLFGSGSEDIYDGMNGVDLAV